MDDELHTTMKTVYVAGRQLIKVRALIIASLLCFGGSIWVAVAINQNTSFGVAGETQLAPLGERIGLTALIVTLALGFLVGMWLYGRCYISKLEVDVSGRAMTISVAGFFWTSQRIVTLSQPLPARRRAGRSNWATTSGIKVDAPYRSIRIPGRSLPLFLDEQGVFLNREIIDGFLRP